MQYSLSYDGTFDVVLCVVCFGISFFTGSLSVCLDDINFGLGS